MMKQLSKEEFLNKIRMAVEEQGSQQNLADHLGISPSYLSDVLNRRTNPGRMLANRLGYTVEPTYAPVDKSKGK